jgi:hypothetical protein
VSASVAGPHISCFVMEQRVDIKLCFTLKEKQLQGARKLSKLIMEKEVLSRTWFFKCFNPLKVKRICFI